MPRDTLERPAAERRSGGGGRRDDAVGPAVTPVLVRLDPGTPAREGEVGDAIATAIAVAWGLGRDVRLVEELRTAGHGDAPVDPVEWELRRRAASGRLAALVARHAEPRCRLDHDVLERFPPEAPADGGTVLGLARDGDTLPWREDAATRRFLVGGEGALLVMPTHRRLSVPVRFDRVMAPLDGSSRAECALPVALAIARRHGAELVLVHAAEAPVLTANGALDAEALALSERLAERNRRVADDYLAELRARHADAGVAIRTRLLEPGDVRRRLVEATRVEGADLVVVAAHGASGHADVLSGAVASYLLERSPVPVLMTGAGAAPCAGVPSEGVANADRRRLGAAALDPDR